MEEILHQAAALLNDADISWAVCGGFALDLFLGRDTRVHGDLDIAVPEENRRTIECFMLAQGWQVYEFRGMGKLRPLDGGSPSEPGRNLMCVREGCELVTFWPCDDPGMVLHEWHPVGIKTLNYMEFLFHERQDGACLLGDGLSYPADKMYLNRDDVPYLAPELVLRYKASQPERDANRADYEHVFPRLTGEQRAWLLQALPPGHPWAAEWWDVYDFRRQKTGRGHRRGDPMHDDEYHLVVQVWIRNRRGAWLISQRAPGKSHPMEWEPTGGSVLAGESSLDGALREVREELGIALDPARGILFCSARREKPTWENPGFLDVWVFEHDCAISELTLQQEETCAAAWATEAEIRHMMADGRFVPMTEDPYYNDLFRFAGNSMTREGNESNDL